MVQLLSNFIFKQPLLHSTLKITDSVNVKTPILQDKTIVPDFRILSLSLDAENLF